MQAVNAEQIARAQEVIREAVTADQNGQYAEALDFYQVGLDLLFDVLRGAEAADESFKAGMKRKIAEYLARAEHIKAQLRVDEEQKAAAAAATAAPDPPAAPAAKRKTKSRLRWGGGGSGGGEPNRNDGGAAATSASASSSAAARRPDNVDFTAGHKRPSAAGTAAGAKVTRRPPHSAAAKRTAAGGGGRGGGAAAAGAAGGGTGGAKARVPLTAGASAAKKTQSAMEQQIMEEALDRSPGVDWDDIAGLTYAKQTLQEAVIYPNLRPDLFTGLRSPPKGVLLFGPPGTGKTMLAKAVASQSGFTFFNISASSVTSRYLGDGEKMMRALFSVAREHQPSVIFFDEIDALMSARGENEHEASRRLKTEFMVQLDGASSNSEDRILVMGATNMPQELDEAVLRRLAKRIYIPLPDEDARRALFSKLMAKQTVEMTEREQTRIVQDTDGYSCSDIKALCQEAAMGPIRELGMDKLRTARVDDVTPIGLRHFREALSRIRPSVQPHSLEVYREFTT